MPARAAPARVPRAALRSVPAVPERAAGQQAGECGGNLLANPGFENGSAIRRRMLEMVATGWETWYRTSAGATERNEAPTYAPRFRRREDGATVLAGLWSQEMASRGATHTAGLWQRVAVPPGSQVEASAWAYAWATDGGDSARSDPPDTYALLVGIDPLGGDDPSSRHIVWSVPVTTTDRWLQLSVEAPVHGSAATIFLRGQALMPLAHNVSRWDATCARVAGRIGEPTPTPTDAPWPTLTPGPEEATAAAALAPALARATRSALEASLQATLAARSGTGSGEPDVSAADQVATAVAAGGAEPGDAVSDGEMEPAPARSEAWNRLSDLTGLVALSAAALIAGLSLVLVVRRPDDHASEPGRE